MSPSVSPSSPSTTAFTGSVLPPPGTSRITSWPSDDFSPLSWIPLHQLPISSSPDAFWYVMHTFTADAHWNRTIFSMQLVNEELFHPFSQTQCSVDSLSSIRDRLLDGYRYNAVRHLHRKTPAPIGGPRGTPAYDAHEATAQYVHRDQTTGSESHIATFSLCIPQHIVTDDNPRALTYWPFQYPKVRAYRFVLHRLPHSDESLLKYEVVPLGDKAAVYTRDFDALKKHSFNSAVKMLKLISKRLAKYDPATNSTSYIKRVSHDNLLCESDFRATYAVLKEKYAFWVQQWPEVTDPQKFVFEEMAIAAYLITLWEQERRDEDLTEKQSFVDLGCGNGFLVYLLISEGHPGIGVDLQKRGIWDQYPPNVSNALRHEEIDPQTYDVSDYDWVLGNHSDELSPWLPVITARAQATISQRASVSTPTTLANAPKHPLRRAHPRFFVLPCCFFDFDGRKVSFGRTRRTLGVHADGASGKYEQYYRWIARIASTFGFTVEYENLRIPSTKYVSILGRFIEHEQRITDDVIQEMTALLVHDAVLSRG